MGQHALELASRWSNMKSHNIIGLAGKTLTEVKSKKSAVTLLWVNYVQCSNHNQSQ